MLFGAFPDDRHEVEDIFAAGDRVAARVTHHGTHLGPHMGVPPSGKHVSQAELHIIRPEHGQWVEHWGAPMISAFCARCNRPTHNWSTPRRAY
jgi:predicted ester cyclase